MDCKGLARNWRYTLDTMKKITPEFALMSALEQPLTECEHSLSFLKERLSIRDSVFRKHLGTQRSGIAYKDLTMLKTCVN